MYKPPLTALIREELETLDAIGAQPIEEMTFLQHVYNPERIAAIERLDQLLSRRGALKAIRQLTRDHQDFLGGLLEGQAHFVHIYNALLAL